MREVFEEELRLKGWSEEDLERRKILRSAGCTCPVPLLGYRPNVGPRCRLCNTVAEIKNKKENKMKHFLLIKTIPDEVILQNRLEILSINMENGVDIFTGDRFFEIKNPLIRKLVYGARCGELSMELSGTLFLRNTPFLTSTLIPLGQVNIFISPEEDHD